jgi:hypothetical protein
MTGLVELSLCRGISLFQSYLLHSNNVDAAESFRSSSIASIMVAQATMAPKFRQRYDRDARLHRLGERRHHDRGRNARNSDWLRLLETVDLLPI